MWADNLGGHKWLSLEEWINPGPVADAFPFSSPQHKGMAMPCYQAASFPKRPILPVSLNTYTNLMGKITDSTISQRTSPSAPAISRNQKDKSKSGKKIKIKINVQDLTAAGFLSPPVQAVCSLLTKLTAQDSVRLLLLDINISKSQKCLGFAIH